MAQNGRTDRSLSLGEVLETIYMDSDSEHEPVGDWGANEDDTCGSEEENVIADGIVQNDDLFDISITEESSTEDAPVADAGGQDVGNDGADDDDRLDEEIVLSHRCMHDVDESDAAQDDNSWTPRNDDNPPPNFTGVSGLTDQPPEGAGVRYFVELFLNDDFFTLVTTQTNLYAEQYIASNDLPPSSPVRRWKPVEPSDMKKFFAIYILTGLVPKSRLKEFWSTDFLVATPVFGSIMSRDRYLLVLRFLHFQDNTTADKDDKLYKVRPLIDMMVGQFRAAYRPTKQVSIDEELVKFKGRCAFRQYIPSKRARFGLKIYALCDSKGYYWNSIMYVGKPLTPLPLTAELGATGALVVYLLADLVNKGHQVYLDNFYTSLPLCTYLLNKATAVCGTLRSNRLGIPPVLKTTNVPKGQYAFRRKGKVQIVKLHDKKVVHLISTMHNASSVKTRKRNRQGAHIHRLRVNHEYNTFMGGVDKNDAMVAAHSGMRKSLKWYIKLALHYIEEALQNAYVTHSQQSAEKPDHYLFLKDAARALLIAADEKEVATAKAHPDSHERLVGMHFYQKLPPTEKKQHPTKPCVVCTAHGRRRETRQICKTCSKKPALCIEPCFEEYHSKLRY